MSLMEATPTEDAQSPRCDGVRLRLRLYDKLAANRGATTPTEQAAFHGISRAHMYRIRNGDRGLSLELAMKMAADLNVAVEDLFERAA